MYIYITASMCMFNFCIYMCIAGSISIYVHNDNSSSSVGSSSNSSTKHSSSSHYRSSGGCNLYYRCLYVYTYLQYQGYEHARSIVGSSSMLAAVAAVVYIFHMCIYVSMSLHCQQLCRRQGRQHHHHAAFTFVL